MIFKVSTITMQVQRSNAKIEVKIPIPEKNNKDKSPVVKRLTFINQINHKHNIKNF